MQAWGIRGERSSAAQRGLRSAANQHALRARRLPPASCGRACRGCRAPVASKPLLSASWRGMTSSARANALMNSCALPGMPRACSLQPGGAARGWVGPGGGGGCAVVRLHADRSHVPLHCSRCTTTPSGYAPGIPCLLGTSASHGRTASSQAGTARAPQVLGQLHVDRAAAGHHQRALERAPHNHDGVVQRAVGLVQELLGTAAQHQGAGVG